MGRYEEQFERIFESLSIDRFQEDPSTIVSYMLNFEFESCEIQLFKNVISNDIKRFKNAISCPEESVNDIVAKIADHCYVSE